MHKVVPYTRRKGRWWEELGICEGWREVKDKKMSRHYILKVSTINDSLCITFWIIWRASTKLWFMVAWYELHTCPPPLQSWHQICTPAHNHSQGIHSTFIRHCSVVRKRPSFASLSSKKKISHYIDTAAKNNTTVPRTFSHRGPQLCFDKWMANNCNRYTHYNHRKDWGFVWSSLLFLIDFTNLTG